MFENFLTITRNQYEAAFSTMNRCLKFCDAQLWSEPIVNLSFSQSAFHTLFYADLYLHNDNDDSFRQQEFHLQNRNSFRDYEELKQKKQENHYEKPFVENYLQHCRNKMSLSFDDATESWLLEPSPFSWIQSTRSEVHIYNIRHIQHHAAQLIMCLRMKGITELPWYRSGWEETDRV